MLTLLTILTSIRTFKIHHLKTIYYFNFALNLSYYVHHINSINENIIRLNNHSFKKKNRNFNSISRCLVKYTTRIILVIYHKLLKYTNIYSSERIIRLNFYLKDTNDNMCAGIVIFSFCE